MAWIYLRIEIREKCTNSVWQDTLSFCGYNVKFIGLTFVWAIEIFGFAWWPSFAIHLRRFMHWQTEWQEIHFLNEIDTSRWENRKQFATLQRIESKQLIELRAKAVWEKPLNRTVFGRLRSKGSGYGVESDDDINVVHRINAKQFFFLWKILCAIGR